MSGLPDSSGGSPNSIDVRGDRNQAIDRNYGTAIGNVGRDIVINQPQPKFLSLHQLPSDIADFTGRAAEIDTIRQQLLGGKSLVISAVAGMAGVGKSALAIHVAQQLAESNFPDVQLYVDLRGADGDGLDPGEVLAGFLRAFGLDDSGIPRDLQERSRVYRSQLVGKRAIVLLDNAKDEAQVRPLLPGNNCAVIITSRRVLGALAGATVFNLTVLNEDEARDLLAKSIGVKRLEAEPEAATEILRLCGGLPLAILIVGGTLKSKLHWRLADYSQKLSDERRRLEQLQLSDLSVRASFELSYRELSPADAMLFGRLGILVGKDFGEELAAVLQESEHPVIDGIERLIDAQLLEANLDRRYRFHDLLRVFAREKLAGSTSEEEQAAIRQQIIDWGCQKSTVMNTYLRPVERRQIVQQWIENGIVAADFDEQSLVLSALAWFEQEREQLLIAIDWANEASRWNMVMFFVSNLLVFLKTRSYWDDWEKICLIGVEASQQEGDLHGKAVCLNNLGMVYNTRSRWDIASDCYQQSLVIYQKLQDRQGESQALNNLGNVYGEQRQWEDAIDCLQQSLTLKRESNNWYATVSPLNNLGIIYRCQDRWSEAIDCFEEVLTICQKLGDRYGESASLTNLGNVYKHQCLWEKAIDCFERSLKICQDFGNRYGTAQNLHNLGMVYNAKRQWSQAINCYQQSLTIKKEIGDIYEEAKTLSNLGILYEYSGEIDLAISIWQEALTKFPKEVPEYQETKKWLKNAIFSIKIENTSQEKMTFLSTYSNDIRSICTAFWDDIIKYIIAPGERT